MELTERRKLEGFPRYCAAEQLLAASSVVVHPYRIIVHSGQPEWQAAHVASSLYAGKRGHATHDAKAAFVFRWKET